MKKLLYLLFIIIFISGINLAQNKDVQVGRGIGLMSPTNAGYFDYSDPAAINIKVNIWGFVKYPGKYVIPSYSKVSDLLSYAGGPTDAARLEEMRIIRTNADSSLSFINVNFDDVLFNSDITKIDTRVGLKAGDVLLVTGSPRFYFSNYFSTTLSIVSALVSLTILILNIAR